MNEPVLYHLLQVENEAAALVEDAQAEADRRLAAGEQQNRMAYDERYKRELAAIDEEYTKKRAALETAYQQEREEYQESLNALPVYRERFFSLVAALLSLDPPQGKER
ncbi:MAG: hypothetical protein LBC51_04905 [Treponema sp.]|jgi:regulator of protease activity HflC (stomatin/prohibitin superfamily)|nr:hypothetical protein [Treponema sp.]